MHKQFVIPSVARNLKNTLHFVKGDKTWYFNVSSMKTKNYYTVILRSDSDEESFEDSSLRSEFFSYIELTLFYCA